MDYTKLAFEGMDFMADICSKIIRAPLLLLIVIIFAPFALIGIIKRKVGK